MITVSILINGNPIATRSAVRVQTGSPNVYHADDGSLVHHEYDDGAVVLAKKLLDTIRLPVPRSGLSSVDAAALAQALLNHPGKESPDRTKTKREWQGYPGNRPKRTS